MSYNTYRPDSVMTTTLDRRVAFIRKTYLHLAGAIGLFVLLSFFLYSAGVGQAILGMMAGSQFMWLLILGGFSIVGYVAQNLARADRPIGTQYLGLALYALAEALIFSPLLLIAAHYAPGVLGDAAIVTLATFTGLSGYVIIYNKDFSFLRGFLVAASFAALGIIIVSAIFGYNPGVWFSGAMILLASGCILYSTSNVLKYYREDQYVGAALELFAAIALLFWYVLRLFLEMNRR